jgi:hypothetical protein
VGCGIENACPHPKGISAKVVQNPVGNKMHGFMSWFPMKDFLSNEENWNYKISS